MFEAAGPLTGRRILLVEDEYLIAEVMEEWLSRAGAVVVGPVPGVAQALELIGDGAGAVDGAVLDVNLGPGATAYPVADRLAELGVPYLFATGDVRIIDDSVHRERPRLDKPVTRPQLLKAVEQLLAARPVPLPDRSSRQDAGIESGNRD
ncbi:response regulator [Roseomonas indoligenes]|uniref:Response regulator n=1 Tax=Roseomonas indoligenes TaxID=2820811 RepID=A0A940MWW2_9PROT|nr:response regulator [Pararoseomonas indoligenes]MBP0492677.1 response regulator [Pararoseomonas indoligenes]